VVRLSGQRLAVERHGANGANGASARAPWLVSTARWVTVRAAIGLGILAVVVLILIHAARSHFPMVPFALVLLGALIAAVYSGTRRSRRRWVPRRTLPMRARRHTRAA